MKHSNLFWGIILITLGALFILKNLDLIFFNWSAIFKLWPLLLVLWGISVLPVKSAFKLVFSFAAIIVTIFIVYNSPYHFKWYGHDNWNNRWDDNRWEYKYSDEDEYEEKSREFDVDSQEFTEPYSDHIEYAQLRIDAAIGEFRIEETTDELMEFYKTGNLGPYKIISKNYNNKKIIELDLKKNIFRGSNFKNEADIKLNTKPVWDLEIDAGAADIEIDLTPFKINNLEIDGGASSIEVRIGDKHDDVELNIDAAASSILIEIPAESGCILDVDTFLSSRSLKGFDKIENGNYRTPGYQDADNKIIINLNAAVASFTIKRY